jgi:hypothetical protein
MKFRKYHCYITNISEYFGSILKYMGQYNQKYNQQLPLTTNGQDAGVRLFFGAANSCQHQLLPLMCFKWRLPCGASGEERQA